MPAGAIGQPPLPVLSNRIETRFDEEPPGPHQRVRQHFLQFPRERRDGSRGVILAGSKKSRNDPRRLARQPHLIRELNLRDQIAVMRVRVLNVGIGFLQFRLRVFDDAAETEFVSRLR